MAVPGDTDPEVVAFLDTLGLRPGVAVRVVEKHPFDGPLVVRVAGRDLTVRPAWRCRSCSASASTPVSGGG